MFLSSLLHLNLAASVSFPDNLTKYSDTTNEALHRDSDCDVPGFYSLLDYGIDFAHVSSRFRVQYIFTWWWIWFRRPLIPLAEAFPLWCGNSQRLAEAERRTVLCFWWKTWRCCRDRVVQSKAIKGSKLLCLGWQKIWTTNGCTSCEPYAPDTIGKIKPRFLTIIMMWVLRKYPRTKRGCRYQEAPKGRELNFQPSKQRIKFAENLASLC